MAARFVLPAGAWRRAVAERLDCGDQRLRRHRRVGLDLGAAVGIGDRGAPHAADAGEPFLDVARARGARHAGDLELHHVLILHCRPQRRKGVQP